MTSDLILSYIQAALFLAVGGRSLQGWLKNRTVRHAHIAFATVLFGIQSLVSAISSTIYDSGEQPRWISIITTILLFAAIYGFILFLSDFLPFPKWVHALTLVTILFSVVMTIIEKPDFRFDPETFELVPIPGISNPIAYLTWVGILLIILAVAFGLLWVAFLVYGLRVRGLARFRMISISLGFFLIFLVVGLLPRLLFGDPSAETIKTFLDIVRYLALASAPLLFLGFTPPKFVTRRFDQ